MNDFMEVFEPGLVNEINSVGIERSFLAGETIISVGQFIRSIPLLKEGSIKVTRPDDKGDEILLYYLEKGSTCAFTLNCCTGNAKSEIKAVAEQDSIMQMIPAENIEQWLVKYSSWRQFVFMIYNSRFMELLNVIDNIAFLEMDQRLVKYLKEKSRIEKSDEINTSHQEIAYDLHTSREVISRLLKQLENKGKVSLKRNKIEIKGGL